MKLLMPESFGLCVLIIFRQFVCLLAKCEARSLFIIRNQLANLSNYSCLLATQLEKFGVVIYPLSQEQALILHTVLWIIQLIRPKAILRHKTFKNVTV